MKLEQGLIPILSSGIYFSDKDVSIYVRYTGLSAAEPDGMWTDGPEARLTFSLPSYVDRDIILKFDVGAFAGKDIGLEQVVNVFVNDTHLTEWIIDEPSFQTRMVFIDRHFIGNGHIITISFNLPNCRPPASLRLNSDERNLGIKFQRLEWKALDLGHEMVSNMRMLGRPVGPEARKTFDTKIESGFWARFIKGPRILDIGFRGSIDNKLVLPITDSAVGVDLGYPGYDGRTLPFDDNSQDAVYSSHCLEHLPWHIKALQEWHRVTKVGGHIIITVPHAYLYERARRPPSRWNEDHQRFYTPASLLAELESALLPNSYRVRYLEDNDWRYDYGIDPDMHPNGCYEIVVVIEKISPPAWRIQD